MPYRFAVALLAAIAAHAQPPTQIKVTGVPTGTPVTVMLMRATGEGCAGSVMPAAEPLPANGLIDVGKHVQKDCWCAASGRVPAISHAGLAVLSQDRSVAYIGGAELCGRDAAIAIALRPRREITVVVHPSDNDMAKFARDDIAHTDWIYFERMVGLTLRPRFLKPDPAVARVTCEEILKSAPGFVAGEINLYYGAGRQNESCAGTSAVLVHSEPVLGDTAHELSHKLGLNQADNEREYDEGHTTGQQDFFGCNNVMWELSDVLQNHLSPAQAFWMSTSCSSFAAHHGPCLPCSEDEGAASPCPPFALGQSKSAAVCDACTLAELQGRVVNTKGRSQLCDRTRLRAALRERHRELRRYIAARPYLQLGHRREGEFLDRWIDRIGVALTVQLVAHAPEGEQRTQGIAYLGQLANNGPERHKQYLLYCQDKITRDPNYRPRCITKQLKTPGELGK